MAAPEMPALGYEGYLDLIDVSKFQGKINWVKVAAAGFVGAIIKTSEGTNQCDPTALENIKGAKDAGLYVLIYGFARPDQGSPAEQVQKMYDCAGDTMPNRAVMDLESAPAAWTPQQKVEFGEAYVEECLKWSVMLPALYTYPDFSKRMQPALKQSKLLTSCPLHIAHYMSLTAPWAPPKGFTPYLPEGFSTWALHQYSGNGGYRVPGVGWDCDRNLFNGDLAAFKKFLGLPEPKAEENLQIAHPFPEHPKRDIPDFE